MKKLTVLLALAAAALLTVTACGADPQPSGGASPEQQVQSSVPQEPPVLSLAVDIKEGDSTIQIPTFKSPGENPQTRALNDKIEENHTKLYEEWKNRSDNSVRELEMKSYLFADEYYVQAVVTQLEFPTYGTQGDIFSYNYDIKHHKAVTLSELFSETIWKVFRSEEDVVKSLTAELALQSDRIVERAEIQGFRILENGGIDCYAKVFFTGSDPQRDPYDMLYTIHLIPSSDTFSFEPYDGATLIPPEEEHTTASSISSAS